MKFSTSTTILESEMRQIPPVFSYSCRRLKDTIHYVERKKKSKESNLRRFSGVSKLPLLTRFMCVCFFCMHFLLSSMDAIELSFSFFRSVCNPVSRRRLSAHLNKFFAALPFSSDAKTPIRPTDGTS